MNFQIEPIRQRGVIHSNSSYSVEPSIIDYISNIFAQYYPQIIMLSQSNELHLTSNSNQQYIINLETLNHLIGLPNLDEKFDVQLKYKDGSKVYNNSYLNRNGKPLNITNKLIDYLDFFIRKIHFTVSPTGNSQQQSTISLNQYTQRRNRIQADYNQLEMKMKWIEAEIITNPNGSTMFMDSYIELLFGNSHNISIYDLFAEINDTIRMIDNATQLAELNSIYQTAVLNFQKLNTLVETRLQGRNNIYKNILIEWIMNSIPNNINLSSTNAITDITTLIDSLNLPINIRVDESIRDFNTSRREVVMENIQIQNIQPELYKLIVSLMLDMLDKQTLASSSNQTELITKDMLEIELQNRNIPYNSAILNTIYKEINSLQITKEGEGVIYATKRLDTNSNLGQAEFFIVIDQNHEVLIEAYDIVSQSMHLSQLNNYLTNTINNYVRKYNDEYNNGYTNYVINSRTIPNFNSNLEFYFSNFSAKNDSNDQTMSFQDFVTKWKQARTPQSKNAILQQFGLTELLYFLLVTAKDINGVPIKEHIKQELSPNQNLSDQLNWDRIAHKIGIVKMFANFYNAKIYILNDTIIIQLIMPDTEQFLYYKYQNIQATDNQELHSLPYDRNNGQNNLQTVATTIHQRTGRTGRVNNITDQIKNIKFK